MSVTRGDFLKQLGKSLPGMVLGSGAALAAQKVIGKMAAASGAMDSAPVKTNTAPKPVAEPEVEFIKHGPLEGTQIALTFDDGPTPGVTDRILDELKQRKLHATFFMIGEHVAAAPDIARRVLAEGHEIGNHSYTHPHLDKLPDAEVERELQRTQDIFSDLLQYRARWFRPPYGALRQNQAHLAKAKQLRIVLWNVDPGDWARPGESKITETILTKTQPGSIIVCHDRHEQTANAWGKTLDGLLEKGLETVTLSALLGKQMRSLRKIKEPPFRPKSLT